MHRRDATACAPVESNKVNSVEAMLIFAAHEGDEKKAPSSRSFGSRWSLGRSACGYRFTANVAALFPIIRSWPAPQVWYLS